MVAPNTVTPRAPSVERIVEPLSGWGMLAFNFALLFGGVGVIVAVAASAAASSPGPHAPGLVLGAALVVLALIFLGGHFTLQPNEARVLILFGAYKGTVRTSGFFWANPFYARSRTHAPLESQSPDARPRTSAPQKSCTLSLRARNFTSDRVKVNDKRGNPIEIAAVVVWRIEDTTKAVFDVEDYDRYVELQSETAIRHIASLYPYDRGDEHESTLRESADEVARVLQQELQSRLARAGVAIDEARITHLAYATEIAHAMLRRQQAEAIIAARQKIVHGAVSMVEQALRELDAKQIVQLDEERKAAMVGNLLVVLCGESEATPIINAGTLYP